MKVIIVGAGIGGLTTAIALQLRGIAYEIYDGAPGNRPLGAGITLGVNAMRVYERLGVATAIQQVAMLPTYLNICTNSGTVLQSIRNAAMEGHYGTGTYGIHRATLQQILLDHVDQPVQWGKRCLSIIEGTDHVAVHFSDGSEAKANIVIGADGIRSAVRESHIETGRYRYSGQTCWRAIVPIDLPAKELVTASEVWSNKGGGLRAMYMQVGPKQVYWWMTVGRPEGSQWVPDQALAFIREQLRDFHDYMPQVLEALRPEYLIHGDLHDLAPLRSWYRGRVVLVGDAAHATTPNIGQGAGQAIEDAWVLAHSLAITENYSSAFERYQQVRIKRAQKIVDVSWQLGQLTNWKGRLLTSLRNGLMRSVPERMMERQLKYMFGVTLEG
ncbi:FAD-dependent monooxygenase [Paraflavitalea pollutisoli]|uniref:FAD-dependent monooxygenase n=1 Tax=Paraflavitalea pollutisoli TaxID=3034143 RepID=UPI0023EADE65|nr:FAD-dependent monooxygenase [Paraflavitalea sp. H1-2-19X]